MPESDDDYVQDGSDDEAHTHRVARGTGPSTRGAGQASRANGGWEVTRTWEDVVEGADGTISSTVEGLLEAGKRKRQVLIQATMTTRKNGDSLTANSPYRLLKDTTPLQRGIIRHLILILDLSMAMTEKDLRPTRYLLTLRYAKEFVVEYFEQNPISQLGVIGMRDGLAVRISDMSGNPLDHVGALEILRVQEPKGNPSLQNALDMARAALLLVVSALKLFFIMVALGHAILTFSTSHAPSHGTREILLVFGSLLSSDPGDIHTTISELVKTHISTSVVGLAAQVAICRTIVSRTNPAMSTDEAYGVALNEQHYRELFMKATTPPVTARSSQPNSGNRDTDDDQSSKSSLLMMGFPSRIVETSKSLCACHSLPSRGGYLCSRCSSKVCALPSTCPACGLTLILSTHLARSYHHLFPLRNWREVSWSRALKKFEQRACFGCMATFPPIPADRGQRPPRRSIDVPSGTTMGVTKENAAGVSESGRYECGTCGMFFCIDCDVFAHEVVHNCPGCLSREGAMAGDEEVEGEVTNEAANGDVVMAEADAASADLERRRSKGKGKVQ